MSEVFEFFFKNLFFFLLYAFVFYGLVQLGRDIRLPQGAEASKGTFLIVERPDGSETRLPVKGKMTIGRAPGSDILLNDEFTSQQHALIYKVKGQIFVRDQGSSNGTRLNGHLIQGEMHLRPGDRVMVGKTNVRVERF